MQPEDRVQGGSVRIDHPPRQRLSPFCPLAPDIHVNRIVRNTFNRGLPEYLSRMVESSGRTAEPQVARRSVCIRRKESLREASGEIYVLVWNHCRISQTDLRCAQDIHLL